MVPKRPKKKVDENDPVIRGLRWILENRRQPDGKRWTQSDLSVAAGQAKSHVGVILTGHQSTDIGIDTLRRYARAGDVWSEWFRTGTGEPGAFEGDEPRAQAQAAPSVAVQTRNYDDPYESRAQLIALISGTAVPAGVIKALQQESFKSSSGEVSNQDPGPAYWRERLAELMDERSEWDTKARAIFASVPKPKPLGT